MKYNDNLNIYILVKILLTPFIPFVWVFGVYTIPFSITFALGIDVIDQISWIFILISLLWIPFLVMNFIKIEKVNRIARVGVIALSCLDILCLLYTMIFGLLKHDRDLYLLCFVMLRLAAIAMNIGCIVYCVKLNSKNKVNDKLVLQPSTDGQE